MLRTNPSMEALTISTAKNRLLKLNLSGCKLDELAAYQLCLGTLQYSFVESLDLSNNVMLGSNFAKTLETLLV